MSALSVVLSGDAGDQVITRHVADVRFSSQERGGFADATLTLVSPASSTLFDRFSHVLIFDSTTGEQVGGGRLVEPGKGPLRKRQVRILSVIGEGIAAMQDVTKPYVLVDSRLDGFHAGSSFVNNTAWAIGDRPGSSETTGWLFQIRANDVGVGSRADLRYYPLVRADQQLGGFSYTMNTGISSSNSRLQAIVSQFGLFTPPDIYNTNWTGTTVERSAEFGGTPGWAPETVIDTLTLRYERVSSSIDPGDVTDNHWLHVSNPRVLALRRGRDGEFVTAPGTYLPTVVYAHDAIVDIFNDAPSLDLESARIDPSDVPHTQLAWPDGVSPYGAANDLIDLTGPFQWAVWERQRNGLWYPEFREQSIDTPRYELTADDGFQPAGDSGSRARWLSGVWVTGTHSSGRPTNLFVPNPNLDALPSDVVGQYIDTISLGQESWSMAAAQAAGEQHIAQSLLSPSAARLTVARRAYDNETGRWVPPWMIRPGALCRVRGVRSERDGLNPRAGIDATIFRIVSMNYSTSSGAVQLELNTNTPTKTRELANLIGARNG